MEIYWIEIRKAVAKNQWNLNFVLWNDGLVSGSCQPCIHGFPPRYTIVFNHALRHGVHPIPLQMRQSLQAELLSLWSSRTAFSTSKTSTLTTTWFTFPGVPPCSMRRVLGGDRSPWSFPLFLLMWETLLYEHAGAGTIRTTWMGVSWRKEPQNPQPWLSEIKLLQHRPGRNEKPQWLVLVEWNCSPWLVSGGSRSSTFSNTLSWRTASTVLFLELGGLGGSGGVFAQPP